MDKLFDLIVMGAKYQLMCASKLDDMIQVRWTGRQMSSSRQLDRSGRQSSKIAVVMPIELQPAAHPQLWQEGLAWQI
jgi:hypothetical protein